MTIVALKNVFNDDIVRNVDAFYPRFEPEWKPVRRVEIDMIGGYREFSFHIPRTCCGCGCMCVALAFSDDDEDEWGVGGYVMVKFENGKLYLAVVEEDERYQPKEGEHIFHRGNSSFPLVVKMIIEYFLEVGKEKES